jgi:hypothetical protein
MDNAISLGTGNIKSVEGQSKFTIQIFGALRKSKQMNISKNLRENECYTFPMPPNEIKEMKYLTVD